MLLLELQPVIHCHIYYWHKINVTMVTALCAFSQDDKHFVDIIAQECHNRATTIGGPIIESCKEGSATDKGEVVWEGLTVRLRDGEHDGDHAAFEGVSIGGAMDRYDSQKFGGYCCGCGG